jgi:hypothetical protein
MKNYIIENLKKLGWYENRKINADKYIHYLDSSQYKTSKYAIQFYSEFGELNHLYCLKFHQSLHFNIVAYKSFKEIVTTDSVNFNDMSPIAVFHSSIFGYYRVFIDSNSDFYLSNGERVASDSWELFDYVMNHFMVEPIPKEDYTVLREAGWYPNRRIDVSQFIEQNKRTGYSMHNMAIKFFQEFGQITLYNKAHNKIDTTINPNYSFATKKSFGSMKLSNPVPVGNFAEFPIFIEENGEIYLGNQEFIGYTPIQAFHRLLNSSYN